MGPELFGVGFAEAVLVLVIALILVGPQRFPEIARQSGRWYRMARRYTAAVTADLRGALDELEDEVKADIDELRSIRDIGDEFESGLADTTTDLDGIARDATPDDIVPGDVAAPDGVGAADEIAAADAVAAPPAARDGGADGSASATPPSAATPGADEDGGDGRAS